MNFYPLKFKPVYKEKIWGGNQLKEKFNRQLPGDKIGESWEVAAHPNGTSIVSNGSLTGKALPTLIEKYPEEILGTKVKYKKGERFPLLIKLLDANAKLSIQVHPDNEYARKVENEFGKTEMWYIIDANAGAKLVYGLKPGTTREELARAIKKGKLESYLNEVTVEIGDIFYMPAGTVHAIEEGILLAEIQQNSDTTYRVYDWNRVDKDGKSRPLHIDKALEVINFNQETIQTKSKPLTVKQDSYTRSFLAVCPYFVTEKIELTGELKITPGRERFYILIPLKGEGKLYYREEEYNLTPGETIFLPAALNEVILEGKLEFLKTYLPISKKEVLNQLQRLGFSQNEINELAGINEWREN